MKIPFRLKAALLLLVCAGSLCVRAQTNAAFQNCQVGDVVKVSCARPILALSKATLLDIGAHTVTVATFEDRFVLSQSNVVLSRIETVPAPSGESSLSIPATGSLAASTDVVPSSPTTTAATIGNYAQALEDIRAQVIEPCKDQAFKEPKLVNGNWTLVVDPDSKDGQKRFDHANDDYHSTMAGLMSGAITQDDLVAQAKAVLQDCDKYKKERQDDPQYDAKIATLRDFVRRSEAGEKFNFKTGLP